MFQKALFRTSGISGNVNTVPCIQIARERVGKHIPTKQRAHEYGVYFWVRDQQSHILERKRLYFPLSPCKVVVRSVRRS
jgi:hypothetical protein